MNFTNIKVGLYYFPKANEESELADWTITGFRENILYISLVFNDPELVSQDDVMD